MSLYTLLSTQLVIQTALSQYGGGIPWKQFLDVTDGMISDTTLYVKLR
jgi:hypothetical protein